MSTTRYLIHTGPDESPAGSDSNKARAIAKADKLHAADKSAGVVVKLESSGAVVYELIAVTAPSKPRASSGPRLDLTNLEARPNVKGYVHSDDDTHGTVATYSKGCRCVTPVEFDGRTIAGCLGATNEYDRWWRAAQAARKAGQPVPDKPTFPKATRARKSVDGKLTGKARADALQARLDAKKLPTTPEETEQVIRDILA